MVSEDEKMKRMAADVAPVPSEEWMRRIEGALHSLLLDASEARRAREFLGKILLEKGEKAEMLGRLEKPLCYAPNDLHWLEKFLDSKSMTRQEMLETGLIIKTLDGGFVSIYRGQIVVRNSGNEWSLVFGKQFQDAPKHYDEDIPF